MNPATRTLTRTLRPNLANRSNSANHSNSANRSELSRRSAIVTLAVVPLLAASAACSSGSTTTTTATASGASSTTVAGASSTASGSASSTATGAAASAGAPAPASAPAFPVTVTGANGPVTLATSPQHIVSMSPTATEVLFAIGAGAQVSAVDSNSTYPKQAPVTKLSAFEPNAEAVAGYKPDLVIISNDSNGFLASLGKLKVPTLVLPAATSLADAYTQMVTIGTATGHGDDATKLVSTTKDRIAAAVAALPASAKGLKVYHELDNTFYSATSDTFIGSVYTLLGLKDIADGAKGAASSGGYPQLSAEYVVTQAPDVIVLADSKCCQQSVTSVAKRPGFAAIPAVKNGKVLVPPDGDDISSRWGPRIADFVEAIATELKS